MMKPILLLPILIMLAIQINGQPAQPETIKLWPNEIPNSIKNNDYKEKIVQMWGKPCISDVWNPELLIYKAPKELSNGTVVIICPGGGYVFLSHTNEGNDIVEWLNKNGITAIILKYRLPSDSIMKDKSIGPLQDAQEAVRIVRRNAQKLGINGSKIGIIGFSAGGHLASTLITHFNEVTYTSDTTSARPNFAVLVYPVISMSDKITHLGSRINLLGEKPDNNAINKFSNELQVTSNTPPTFLVHSSDDGAVPVMNSILFYSALQKAGVKSELHIYQTGGHGYGLAKGGKTESEWSQKCIQWLKLNNWCK